MNSAIWLVEKTGRNKMTEFIESFYCFLRCLIQYKKKSNNNNNNAYIISQTFSQFFPTFSKFFQAWVCKVNLYLFFIFIWEVYIYFCWGFEIDAPIVLLITEHTKTFPTIEYYLYHLNCVTEGRRVNAEVYSELFQTSKIKAFCETSQRLEVVNYFTKNSILDVWQFWKHIRKNNINHFNPINPNSILTLCNKRYKIWCHIKPNWSFTRGSLR